MPKLFDGSDEPGKPGLRNEFTLFDGSEKLCDPDTPGLRNLFKLVDGSDAPGKLGKFGVLTTLDTFSEAPDGSDKLGNPGL